MHRNDYISLVNLAASMRVTPQTVNLWLTRTEFNHKIRFYIGRRVYFRNLDDEDIQKLRKYTKNARKRKRKKNERKNSRA